MHPKQRSFAIVGAGSIGVAWAVVFARAGGEVRIWEPDRDRRMVVIDQVTTRLDDLQEHELLGERTEAVIGRVNLTGSVKQALNGADHIQECAPEDLETKQRLFAEFDQFAPRTATLASSSSAIPASSFASELHGRERCLVAHPGNPPHLIPVVEIVPAPFTAGWAIEQIDDLMRSVQMTPIIVRRELEGFVFNRLQGAVLREAYCLVRDGIVSPSDLDKIVSEGLGRRWSIVGPFATAELNTRGGLEAHAARLGRAYARMGAERGQDDPWDGSLVASVAADIHRMLPPENWEENVLARDRALMSIERCRREHGTFSPVASGSV